MYKIAVIVGSLRKESFNRKLALALQKLNHPKLQFDILDWHEFPVYNQDHENNMPNAVKTFKISVTQADALLFITPEYNRSIPGGLKNVIDWGTRPYGENCWAGKLCAIIGTSPGAVGTAVAQSHLRSILTAIDVTLFSKSEVYLVYKEGLIDNDFRITNENTHKFLQKFLDTFALWVEKEI